MAEDEGYSFPERKPKRSQSTAAIDKRWDKAVDMLINSRYTTDLQEPFWDYVDGHITEAAAREAIL